MPNLEGKLNFEITENGQIVKSWSEKMNSFCDALAKIIGCLLANVSQAYTDYGGVSRTNYSQSNVVAVIAAGDDTAGILVGTGDTAYDHSQYALVSKIAHGTGSGQLQYGVEVATNPTWDGSTKWTWDKYRVFANVSGDSIIVKEKGLVFKEAAGSYKAMVAREVGTPITLANSQSLKVTYSFELTK